MAKVTKSVKVDDLELKAEPDGCQEASPQSTDFYIPCNRPARWRMQSKREGLLRMCDFCADHNERRGFKNLGPFPTKSKQPKETTAEWIAKASKTAVKAKDKKKASDIDELEEASAPQIGHNIKAEITAAVDSCVAKMQELEQAEELCKQLKSEIHHINNRVLPELLFSIGTTTYKSDTTGAKVVVGDFINGSLPKDPERREAAMEWLEANDGGDLIKHAVSMQFGRNSQEEVARVTAALKKLKVDYKDELNVHAGTLAKYARERMEAGEDVPFDLLGLYVGKMAKITLPKKDGSDGE